MKFSKSMMLLKDLLDNKTFYRPVIGNSCTFFTSLAEKKMPPKAAEP